jgi:hypothetical protein
VLTSTTPFTPNWEGMTTGTRYTFANTNHMASYVVAVTAENGYATSDEARAVVRR